MGKGKEKNRILLSALLVMLLWGSLFPVVKMGFAAYDVESVGDILLFAGIRFAICGAVISVFSFFRFRQEFKNLKYAWGKVLLSGVFAITLHYSFTYLALNLTDSSKTAILKQVGVLFYVCFSSLFIKDDKLTARKLIGAILGFAGIIAINADGQGTSFNLGDCLIIAASFCTVFSNIISKGAFERVDPIVSTGISQLFGGMILLIIGASMGGRVVINHSFGLMGYLCIASIVSYCIWFGIVKKGELSKLFIIKFAEPVFASVFAAILLNENIFQVQYLVAFVAITAGISVSN